LAVDLSPTLIALARERQPRQLGAGRIEFRVGDLLDGGLGQYDHVVAMDSLIHYDTPDMLAVLAALAARTRHSMVFTFAPRTAFLTVMHAVGQWFPRGNRSPMIEPVSESRLAAETAQRAEFAGWQRGRSQRVVSSFYISQAMELVLP
jgi:magnesium-protoporphyrin O-methyltransferase